MIVLVDFEKAFDLVRLKFSMTTFDIFNFCKNVKQWIKTLLGMDENSGFQAVTVVNGNILRRTNLDRGCRQGYLFILTIKLLALLLKK